MSAKFFNKDLDCITERDMEMLVKALNNNTLLKMNGKKYSEQTKSNIKKVLIMFLRFNSKDKVQFEKITDWVSTSFKKKEILALREEEIKKLLRSCNTLKQKVLVVVLFDTGARIEEFLNIRLGDIIEVVRDMPYYKLTLRNEFSKTKGRTFGLFWNESTEVIRAWLEQHPHKSDMDAVFYDSTYAGVGQILRKLGKRALNKHINPHLFRHSSATYYAGQGMDYFNLCTRFGWSIGSNVPKDYIDRSGIKDKEFSNKVENKRIEDLNRDISKLNQQDKVKADLIEQLTKRLFVVEEQITKKHMDKAMEELDVEYKKFVLLDNPFPEGFSKKQLQEMIKNKIVVKNKKS
jgi:site-specific recombinase XerD